MTEKIPFTLLFLLSLLLVLGPEAVSAGDTSSTSVREIQSIVGDFLLELGLSETVYVAISPANERLVSVERFGKGDFLMSFDRNFLEDLNQEDLRATIAHELGHVWIFTHHPYLHTEELANRIALKLVSRECLERIYERVSHVIPQTTSQGINYLPSEVEQNATP